MPNTRLHELTQWLESLPESLALDLHSIQTASSDASFRRYFRISTGQPEFSSLIIMDAPVDKEDVKPFIQVAKLLSDAGLNAPKLIESNLHSGFLLLSDLGVTTYLSALNEKSANALYKEANLALVKMQTQVIADNLAHYDESLLHKEMQLFPEWYLQKHLNYSLSPSETESLNQVFDLLKQNALAQPQVFVHRDFHSRNLMVTEQDSPGILDFQDAVKGPITYDLVSLYRDAYIQWDEEQQMDWVIRYWEIARKAKLPIDADFGEFYRDFEWMGLQRHLKVLGIFARLYHRDGKDGYLSDIPMVLDYTEKVAQRYTVFKPLIKILDASRNFTRPNGLTF